MSLLKERFARLSPEQRTLLAKRLNRSVDDHDEPARRPQGVDAPLSYSQERLWFLEQVFPGLPVHNICGVATHHGPFNAATFYTALRYVVGRHEALHSAFETLDGVPRVRVVPVPELERSEIDLSAMDETLKRTTSDRLLAMHAKRPFDLERGVLVRASVIRLSPAEHRVMVCMHHIASDGWSTAIIIREVLEAYQEIEDGIAPNLPALPLTYGDVALWQRRRMSGVWFENQMDFWTDHLRDLPVQLELPADKTRPAEPRYTGGRVPFVINDTAASALFAMVARERVTPFMVLLAIYATLIYRYSAQQDFAIGVPVAGRDHHNLEKMVGCFINLVPIRFDMSGNPTFSELLSRTRTVVLSALEHAEIPFELIVNRIRPDRDANFAPLFQVSFSFEREATDGIAPSIQSEITFEEVNFGVSRYDLSLELTAGKHGLKGWFDFSNEIFEKSTIDNLVRHFLAILEFVVEDPNQTIGQLPLLSASEKTDLILLCNAPPTDYPRDTSIPALFQEQARTFQGAAALVQGDRVITYDELRRSSSAFAALLRETGMPPGSTVALCVQRSMEAVVAILGILEAGAAYVPFELDHPKSRTEQMLASSQVFCAVCDEAGEHLFAGVPDLRVLRLGADVWKAVDAATDIPCLVGPTDLAYVMYTSGSTGEPKGVAVSHRNVIRLVRGTDYASFGPQEVGLQFAPLSFDASTFEIWAQLLNGGTLVIAPPGPMDFKGLGDVIAQHGVTTLWLTAGLFRGMVDENLEGLRPLRQLLTGGDVVPELQARKVLAAMPSCRLINGYGPTEGTTFSCCHTIVAADLEGATIPIGRPIANTTAYILDRFLQPVPRGVHGELFLGGDGVAQGYFHNPVLTAKSFLKDPFRQDTEAMMYRTGDQVCLLPGNEIRFLGRLDEQFKLRGFRIEPGEIEAALSGHQSVRNAAVIMNRDAGGGEPHLCAYLVLAEGTALTAADAKSFLRTRLPEYMVPTSFIVLDELPLTRNGKVDKKSLPLPEALTIKEHQEPIGEIEKKLAVVWKDLLKLETIGRNDNFFDLFGDSISALQMVSKASRAGLRFTSRDVFARQSLADLASIAQPMEQEVAIEQTLGEVPLTPIQDWFFGLGAEKPAHWNQWVLFRMSGAYSVEDVQRSLDKVVERHDIFRLRFAPGVDQWTQYLVAQPSVGFASLDVSSMSPIEQEEALTETGNRLHRELDLTNGPLFRLLHVKGLRGERSHLFCVAHHLVIDQFSWQIFLEELQLACEFYATHREPRFSPRTMPFAKAAKMLQSSQLALQYGAADRKEARDLWNGMPWERARSLRRNSGELANLEREARVEEWTLDLQATADLKAAQRTFRTRIDDFLVMAVSRILCDYNDHHPVVLEIESMGRLNGPEVGRTMGWFTQMYPVVLDTHASLMDDFIKSSKELLRGMALRAPTYISVNSTKHLSSDSLSPLKADVAFNYLGEISKESSQDVEFGLSANQRFVAREPATPRSHLINIDAFISDGRLKLVWTFASRVITAATVRGLIDSFACELQQMSRFCLGPNASTMTPSDFPLARLDQRSLDRVFQTIEKRNPAPTVPSARIEDMYALSPLQEGLLYHAFSKPESDDYIVQLVMHLEGELVLSSFQQAWKTVIERHAALRTGFHFEGLNRPVQVVEQTCAAEWSFLDLSATEDSKKESMLTAHLRLARNKPFHLCEPPLTRFEIVTLDKQQSRFIWTYHHLILDGWSMAIVLRDVFSIYEGLVKGEPRGLPSSPPFRNFIASLQAKDHNDSLEMWRSRLAGFEKATPLPALAPVNEAALALSPANDQLSRLHTATLLQGAQRRRLTLATVLHGAWALMLAASSGLDDVVLGSAVSGRTLDGEDLEAVVGLLINTVPARVRIVRKMPLSSWMEALQEDLSSTRAHEHCGLVDIRSVSAIGPGLPLFESVVVVENYPIEEGSWEEYGLVKVTKFESFEKAHFPLYLTVIPGEMLRLRVFFDPHRFSGERIQQITSSLKQFLEQLASRWDETVGSVMDIAFAPLLNTAAVPFEIVEQYEHQDRGSAATQIQPAIVTAALKMEISSKNECIHHLFEAVVADYPTSIALVQGNRSLTYAELNAKADALAGYLRQQGVGRDRLVAICVDRSPEMLIAMLATWKAGGAFVPLDSTYPVERLKFMLQDSEPRVLLTQTGLKHLVVQLQPLCPVVDLSAEEALWAKNDATVPAADAMCATSRSLAYVIYTSGSTGRPKGVMNEHRGLCNLARVQRSCLNVGPDARVLQFSSFSFDACVFEVVMALCSGAALYLPPPGPIPIGEALARMVQAHQLTHAVLPPAALETQPQNDGMGSIRMLMVAGDAPSEKLMRHWSTGRQLFNGYGPTETTICATMHEYRGDEDGKPPIGRPLANVSVYILDGHGKQVQVGTIGEICIGGIGVARGYLKQPGRTAEKFVMDPFSSIEGERMYKSGDLGSWLPNGTIQFMGRNDFQVKVRGFRVELGEIEARLLQYAGVESAIVLSRTDKAQQPYLVAYYTLSPGCPAPQPVMLRRHLSIFLQNYMIPAAYVLLPAMPLTPNGKLDRSLLQAPSSHCFALSQDYAAPVGKMEMALAGIWTDLLEVGAIGRDDNFYQMGGHSLLMMRMQGQLSASLGKNVSVVDLLQYPSVRLLAQFLSGNTVDEQTTADLLDRGEARRVISLAVAHKRRPALEEVVAHD